jgi:hypothetical protein
MHTQVKPLQTFATLVQGERKQGKIQGLKLPGKTLLLNRAGTCRVLKLCIIQV